MQITQSSIGFFFKQKRYLSNVLFSPSTDGTSPQSADAGARSVRSAKKSEEPSKLTLPVFGLASYKFRGSLWRSDGQHEQQLLSFLLQAADDWLRDRQVEHPDYHFFISRYGAFRR